MKLTSESNYTGIFFIYSTFLFSLKVVSNKNGVKKIKTTLKMTNLARVTRKNKRVMGEKIIFYQVRFDP